MLLDFQDLKNKYNLQINGVIHVGAHYGQEIKLYNENGIYDIICFEPVVDSFNILKNNCTDRCNAYNLALGNKNQKITINLETNNQGQSSSILDPEIHLTQYPHIKFNSKAQVNMVRLDDFMEKYKNEQKNKNFNFINIDVQGYELEVFKGAVECLKNIDYIIAEVNKDFLYKNCALVNEIDDFLKQFNFERKETNWAGNTWGDALYIKKITC
jgi:FkbM family methyltransferase